jgi:hypothetical protein
MLKILSALKRKIFAESIPSQALKQLTMDQQGLGSADPGPNAIVAACTNWLCSAQDNSASADGGVARHYS